jgi:hypothetical protein
MDYLILTMFPCTSGSSSVSLWEDINSSMQKLDPMHIEIVEYSTGPPLAAGRGEYSRGVADYCRLAEEEVDEDREYLVREYSSRLQQDSQEYIKAEPGKEQDFIALVNDSIGYCYDTNHQVRGGHLTGKLSDLRKIERDHCSHMIISGEK